MTLHWPQPPPSAPDRTRGLAGRPHLGSFHLAVPSCHGRDTERSHSQTENCAGRAAGPQEREPRAEQGRYGHAPGGAAVLLAAQHLEPSWLLNGPVPQRRQLPGDLVLPTQLYAVSQPAVSPPTWDQRESSLCCELIAFDISCCNTWGEGAEITGIILKNK